MRKQISISFLLLASGFFLSTSFAAETFRVAAYNVENLLNTATWMLVSAPLT